MPQRETVLHHRAELRHTLDTLSVALARRYNAMMGESLLEQAEAALPPPVGGLANWRRIGVAQPALSDPRAKPGKMKTGPPPFVAIVDCDCWHVKECEYDGENAIKCFNTKE